MKKVLLLFLLFPVLSFSDVPCDCSDVVKGHWVYFDLFESKDIGGTFTHRDNAADPLTCDDYPAPPVGETCPTDRHMQYRKRITGWHCNFHAESTDGNGHYSIWEYGGHEWIKRYRCVGCNEPDEDYPDPSPDLNLTLDSSIPPISDCASPDDNQPSLDACSVAGGNFYSKSRVKCCTTSFCWVPKPEPQCPPDFVPSPDHPEICIHDPHGPCPVDREMCICGGNGENDQCKYSTHDCIGWRSYDVPSCSTPTCDTGLIDTSGHCCEPGQILCHGQCQLSGVPCNPDTNDTNPNDPNNPGNNPNDPCSYPLKSQNNLPKQGTANSIEDCVEDGRTFGQVDCNNNPVAADFIKNDGCDWGGCYYTSWTSPPKNCQDNNNTGGSDGNSTGGSGSSGGSDSNSSDGNSSLDSNGSNLDIQGVKDRLDKINDQVKKQGGRLNTALQQLDTTTKGVKTQVKASGDQISSTLDSLNKSIGRKLDNIDGSLSGAKQSLGLKLDNIVKAINDKSFGSDSNSSPFVPSDLNVSPILVNQHNRDIFFNKLNNINNKMNDASTLMDSVLDEFTTFKGNVESAYSQLIHDFQSYKTMFNNKPTVTMSTGGSCDLSTEVFGGSVDFGSGLCPALRLFSPFVVFILTIMTKLSLIFIAIKFFKKD